ncbi:lipopolysaccharide biosynthesis protein [Aliikangiella sp. IMCC44653]
MDNMRDKIISGFAWEASTKLLIQVFSWVSTIWVARMLTPDDYGLIGISGIYTGVVLMFSGMGLGAAIVNKDEVSESELHSIFWTGLLFSLVCYSGLFLLGPVIESYYQIEHLSQVIRVAGLIVILSMLTTVPHALILRQMDFKTSAMISFSVNFILMLSTLGFALLGYGFWSLVWSVIISQIFGLCANFYRAKYIPGRPSSIKTLVDFYRYGFQIMTSGLVNYISTLWGPIYTGHFLGQTATGNFQMANILASMPLTKIGEIFNQIVFPSVSRIKHDLNKSKSLFLKMHSYLLIITLPLFSGLALVAEDIIPLLLGEKWVSIITPVQILCVLCVMRISAQIVPKILEGIGNPRANVNYQIILSISMALSMLLGVQWGLNWMLVAWTISFPIAYIYLFRVLCLSLKIEVSELWQSVSSAIYATLIMALVVLLIRQSTSSMMLPAWANLIASIGIGGLVYLGSYFLLNRQQVVEMVATLKSFKR